MTQRDLNVALSAGDLAALELLRADRDGCDEGVARHDLEAAGCTRYPDSLCARLRAHGYVIGVTLDGRFQLGHSEPEVERSGGGGEALPPEPPAGASLGGQLTLFERGGRMPASSRGMDARGLSTAA